MGDRGQIVIIDSKSKDQPALYFYTHWFGSDLPTITREGLVNAQKHGRLDDESYAARIIFDTLTSYGSDAGTGFGIQTYPAGDADTVITLDFGKKSVDFHGMKMTFEQYINAGIDDDDDDDESEDIDAPATNIKFVWDHFEKSE